MSLLILKLSNSKAIKTSECEDVIVSPSWSNWKTFSNISMDTSGKLMDSRDDYESFTILLSKGENLDMATINVVWTIETSPILPMILVPICWTSLKDFESNWGMTGTAGLGTASDDNNVLFLCCVNWVGEKWSMHNLGPLAPTIIGRSIPSEVIHCCSFSSSFGKENFPWVVLHT